MDFAFSKDQNLVRKSAREFLEKECPKDRTRKLMVAKKGYDPRMWKKMAQLGFTGLAIPEEYEGTGGDFLELAIFMEEMGRNIVPSPFFTTVCLCALAIEAFGTETQKNNALPEIAHKGRIWSLALNEDAADYEPTDVQIDARAEGSGYVLNGQKFFVPYAHVAKKILVAARTGNNDTPEEGITVFMVNVKTKGISIEEMSTAAPGKKSAVRFEGVWVDADHILGDLNKGWNVLDFMITHGAVLKAAEMSGGTKAAMDLAVKYAKERTQFDTPIASHQALQHKLVKMLTEVDGLRNQTYEAAWNIAQGTPSLILNSAAKAKANIVYHRVCFDAVVIHGAIGWTAEMDVSLYLLRAKDLENDCGGTAFHQERVARELEAFNPNLSVKTVYR